MRQVRAWARWSKTRKTAAIYANKNAETFLDGIDPANPVTGVVVLEIPKGVQLTELELHNSPSPAVSPSRSLDVIR